MTWTDWTNEGVESDPEDYVDDDGPASPPHSPRIPFPFPFDDEDDTYFDWDNN